MKQYRRYPLLLLIILIAVASISAQSTDEDVPTFKEALVGQVQRLNPLFANLNPVDQDITALLFRGLAQTNEFGEPVPDLALDWVISRNGIEYVVQLRDDIIWHDGEIFDADDVLFTLGLLADVNFVGNPELGRFWQTVEVQKINNYLIRFRLAQPLASFLNQLTIGILPEHVLRGTTSETLATHPFNLSPIGTGRFQLEALRSRDGVRIDIVDLRLAPAYWQPNTSTSVHRLRFYLYDDFGQAVQALQEGIVNGLATSQITQRLDLLNIDDLASYTSVIQRVGFLVFNWDEGDEGRFFSEQRVRVALQTALNTRVPVESQLANRAIAADSPLPITSWAYDPNLDVPETNSVLALQLLEGVRFRFDDEANAQSGNTDVVAEETADPEDIISTLSDVRFSILVPDMPEFVNLAQEIATQWSVLGLQVTVEAVPNDVHQQRLEDGDFQVALLELNMGSDPDIYPYWHGGQYPDGLNFGGVSDDTLSELLERARRDANGINRIALYRTIQERFIDRAIAIPLYYPLFTYVVSSDIRGVQLGFIGNDTDRFRTIEMWRFTGNS